MAKGLDKTRLSIAVFDRGNCLCQALADLAGAGFEGDQMGIAALASTLVALQERAPCAGVHCTHIVGVIAAFETTPTKVDDQFVVVTRNSLWQKFGCFGAIATDALFSANWMTLKLQDDLTDYIKKGAVVLGVSARDLSQQRQSTRILLQHSSQRVQTHEFIL